MSSMESQRLPDGATSEHGLDILQAALTSILQLDPAEYGDAKAKIKQKSIDDVKELIDPEKNPGAYRLCQNAVLSRGALGPFLRLAQNGCSDSLRNRALEVLARVSFGNPSATAAIAQDCEFLPALRTALGGHYVERVAALQLAQQVAASSASCVVASIPALVAEVAPHLSDKSFDTIPREALEVLISASFHDHAAVASAVRSEFLVTLVSEDADRASFLPVQPLHILTCGLLAVNLLQQPLPEGEDADARGAVHNHLACGNFVEYFVNAMDAASKRCAWPADSGAYHSPERLAGTIVKLVRLGYAPRLLGVIPPLAETIGCSEDASTTQVCLCALRALCCDVACIEALLGMEQFRREVLDVLHTSGDSPEATELASLLEGVEGSFSAASDTLAQSRTTNAPSVRHLAVVFNTSARLWEEISNEQVLGLFPAVPLAPQAAVKSSLSGRGSFTFLAFAQHVYGTPTILGWWPSLMEDVAALRADHEMPALMPELTELARLFEAGVHGRSCVTSDTILHEVLPNAGLLTEGEVVEDMFAEIRGITDLPFLSFAKWLSRLCTRLAAEQQAESPETQ